MAATMTTRWDQVGGGGGSRKRSEVRREGINVESWGGTADGIEPCFHPQQKQRNLIKSF